MKRSVLSLFFSAMLLASIHPLGSFAEEKTQEYNCRKGKTTTIEYVESSDDSNVQIKIPVGTWKYTLTIDNNHGVGPFGIQLKYDKNVFEPMVYANGRPVIVKGTEWSAASTYKCSVNTKDGILGVAGMTDVNVYDNGDIVTFYLKEKPNVDWSKIDIDDVLSPPKVLQSLDAKTDPNNYKVSENSVRSNIPLKKGTSYVKKEYIRYYYTLGDVNGDGQTSLEDSQALCSLLGAFKGTGKLNAVSIPVNNTNDKITYNKELVYKGVFVNDERKCRVLTLEVADVNCDNRITIADADIIMDYYMDVLCGFTPSNPYKLGTQKPVKGTYHIPN